MPTVPSAAQDVLAQLCHDLGRLREQAGGPSVRTLADEVGLGKSQVGAILTGRIRRPPEWDVLRGLVTAIYTYARDHGREQHLSIRSGLEEYWRPRHTMVEHASGSAGRVQGPGIPRQLPPAGPHLVGRVDELATLTRAAERDGPLLITGMAGVGKTTLALTWAHRSADRFPDGQLYLNLRGFDPSGSAMTVAQAIRALLDGLAVPPRQIPFGIDAQAGLYRSLLAQRRMLVLLDNARDAEQVRVLLPGSPTCRALVTSRTQLTGLVAAEGAYPLTLEVLTDADARQLLSHRLGEARVSAEPAAVDRLVTVTGRLPIALAIVAARGATRPDFPLSAIAAETDPARGGLDAFQVGDAGLDIRGVFSWSYRDQSPAAARLFRLLGAHGGTEVSTPAAASLAGLPRTEAAALLAQLTRAHLVLELVPGRYGLHDLLRTYAIELTNEVDAGPERDAAVRRILDHYAHSGHAAAMALSPQRAPIGIGPAGPGVSPERFDGREESLAWFGTELAILLAAVERAATGGYDAPAWILGWALADFLELRGRFDDWIAVQTHAVAAAERIDEPLILARLLVILGSAYWRADRLDEALPPVRRALDGFRGLGDLAGQARTEINLGGLMEAQGRFAESLEYAEQALAHYRAAGDPDGQARAHNAIGWSYCQLDRPERAIEHCERALAGYEQLANPNGQAATWDSLGYAYRRLGRHDQAARCYGEAIGHLREVGDRYNEAATLGELGEAQEAAGDLDAALESWTLALTILDELGNPDAVPARARLDAAQLRRA